MKKIYEQPIVEVMDARVEKGFAGSGSESQPEHGEEQYSERSEGYMFN